MCSIPNEGQYGAQSQEILSLWEICERPECRINWLGTTSLLNTAYTGGNEITEAEVDDKNKSGEAWNCWIKKAVSQMPRICQAAGDFCNGLRPKFTIQVNHSGSNLWLIVGIGTVEFSQLWSALLVKIVAIPRSSPVRSPLTTAG